MSTNVVPRKLTVFLAAPPGDGLRPAREYFHEYVKPILVAAAVDWDVVEGRREGELRAAFAERIRKLRRKDNTRLMEQNEEDAIADMRQKLGIAEEEEGGDLVLGRHTWKEYVRGLHEGWLGPLDLSPEPALEEPVLEKVSVVDSTSENAAEEKLAEEKPKAKPEPGPLPPLIRPDSYPSSTASSLPSTFPPSTAIPFPHILGFLNTPVRTRRFLNRREQAEETGKLVASLILASSHRPYDTSTHSPDEDPWEQQRLLAHEEREWHKVARTPNPEGEENKERPWNEEMIIDDRVGRRMRMPELVEDPTDITVGNPRDWKGGVDRMERVSWGVWLKQTLGMEVEEPKCKGWDHGLVNDETE